MLRQKILERDILHDAVDCFEENKVLKMQLDWKNQQLDALDSEINRLDGEIVRLNNVINPPVEEFDIINALAVETPTETSTETTPLVSKKSSCCIIF